MWMMSFLLNCSFMSSHIHYAVGPDEAVFLTAVRGTKVQKPSYNWPASSRSSSPSLRTQNKQPRLPSSPVSWPCIQKALAFHTWWILVSRV